MVQTEKFNQIANVSSGSKMPRADWNYMSEIPFDIPPLKEQKKIAEILTTWDEAITKQTELLEAKELQKKALMQKLLSGEVRFDGFSDKWEEVRIDKLFDFKKGQELSKEKLSRYIDKASDELDKDWEDTRKGKPGLSQNKVANRFQGLYTAQKRKASGYNPKVTNEAFNPLKINTKYTNYENYIYGMGGFACVSTLHLILLMVGILGTFSQSIMMCLICISTWGGMRLGEYLYHFLGNEEEPNDSQK